jgi:hypothetical protein
MDMMDMETLLRIRRNLIYSYGLVCVALTFAATPAFGQEPATTVGAFVDVYYSYSVPAPPSGNRSYTTQPLRHNEFNLNLAMLEVKHRTERIRGRFAFQTGTYVESNLLAEPSLLKNVLEASAGVLAMERVWIDFGIFPSHIGFEGILSKDNWNYSRSLVADYSPYYEAGLSIAADLSDQIMVRGLVMNGWQNIRETNSDKAFGSQVQFKPSGSVLLNWSTFVGNEAPDSVSARVRVFNDFYGVFTLSSAWSIAMVFDVGLQEDPGRDSDLWHGGALLTRWTPDDQWAVSGRVEYYSDPEGVIIATGTPNNFQTVSASVNIDLLLVPGLLWRVEGRVFRSDDAIYPSSDGTKNTDAFIALSAGLSL